MRTSNRFFLDRFGSFLSSLDFGFKTRTPRLLTAIAATVFGLIPMLVGCGAGVLIPGTEALRTSPGELEFGDVNLGQSSVKTIVLSNTSGTSVAVSQINFSSPAFSRMNPGNLPILIPAGSNQSISVGFQPIDATDYSAEMVVVSNAKPVAQIATHGRGQGSTKSTVQMSVSVNSLDFGSVTVNSSSTQTLTLTSTGTAPLIINSATISGAGFSLMDGALPATLNPNQSLTLQVQFSPTITGMVSGQLTISSNSSSNGTITLPLGGSGTTTQLPSLGVSAGSLSFGNVTVNSSSTQTLTLTSTGTSPLTISSATLSGVGFSLMNGALPATLNPNQSLTLQVQFSPKATGMASGQLTINSNSSSSSTMMLALSGMGTTTPLPILGLSAGSLSFGTVTAGASTMQTLTLSSTGAAPVIVNTATISNSSFAVVGANLPTTLNPGQTMPLQVRFNPAGTGPVTGQLIIGSNSSTGSAAVVALSGTGTATPSPQLTVSSGSVAFGNVTVSTSATQFLTLTSTGTSAVSINSATISGTGFTIVPGGLPITLNPAQSVTLQVQFSPLATGASTGQLRINSDATSGAINLVVSGTGISGSPQLTVNSATLGFGNVSVNTSAQKTLSLTSTGTSPVTVNAATVSGTGFTLVGGSFPVTLTPSQTLTLQIQFLPAANGTQTGQVRVLSDSTAGDLVVALSGTGMGAAPEVDLSWDAPTNSPIVVAAYNLYRSTGSSGSFSLLTSTPAGTVIYIDRTVTSGNSYSYIVKSIDAAGIESTPSNQINVSVP